MANYADGIDSSIKYCGDVTGLTYLSPASDTTSGNLGTDLLAMVTASNLRFRNVAGDAQISTANVSTHLLRFGANSDTIDDRILFTLGQYNANGGGTGALVDRIYHFNDTGDITTTNNNTTTYLNTLTNADLVVDSSWQFLYGVNIGYVIQYNANTLYCAGFTDGESLGVVQFLSHPNIAIDPPTAVNCPQMRFFYAGKLDNPHASLSTQASRYVSFYGRLSFGMTSGSLIEWRAGRCQINNTVFGTSYQESYPAMSCANSTVPNSQWAMPFEVRSGGTVYGTAKGLLRLQGNYSLFVPIRIAGSGGNETWLPISYYGTLDAPNFLAMRCYSSVI